MHLTESDTHSKRKQFFEKPASDEFLKKILVTPKISENHHRRSLINTDLFEKKTKKRTACYYRVMYAFQSESTLYSCLNVKELLARNMRDIMSNI